MTEPSSKVYFVNIYSPLIGACGSVYENRELADQMAGKNRLACKEIYVRPGEGIAREEKSA
ncbi:hypothetical protein [uncultured Bradyrhizobium sp.]|uniref:hypothetical protein n=1 Tax=uncultured Bradyrhizobium sp. TaxID=199684 RepID=UPI0035CC7F59